MIPLLGDRDSLRPKVPATHWLAYQQYRSTLNEHQQWFTENKFAGLGIVTGRVSQLVVLDFDTESVFSDFKAHYPDLLETRTVRSAGRQLPHLYFKLPAHLHMTSQRGQGVDLLSDGRYVVAPPTTINNQAYKMSRGGMPKTLTDRDIRRIQHFLAAHRVKPAPIFTESRPPSSLKPTDKAVVVWRLTSADLQALYCHHLNQKGRNESLFLTSLYARDAGWTLEQTQNSLLELHSHQPTAPSHARETPDQRKDEAVRTIHSAFSRPARPMKPQYQRSHHQLFNSVREKLMQQKMTYVVRTYEALLQVGIHPGQLITAQEAIKHLKGLVGRDSVLNALRARQGDQSFFSPPVNPPLTAKAVATDNPLEESKKCYLIERKNQYKPQGGRPNQTFRMPYNHELCAILGVKQSGSDPLERADLVSARQTRMALHRELIKRRPGQYPRGWLARRLGISKRTIDTYNQIIPIHSRAMFIETPIYWSNIERLPSDEALCGAYLVTVQGKKYPALRTIASRLLATGEGLRLKQQTVNFYWYRDTQPPIVELTQVHEKQTRKQEVFEAFMAQNANIQPPESFLKDQRPLQLAPQQRRTVKTPSSNCRKPLADTRQEALANFIYKTINCEDKKTISMTNARRITLMQPEDQVRAALNRLQHRKTVINPTGYLTTILRSNKAQGIDVE